MENKFIYFLFSIFLFSCGDKGNEVSSTKPAEDFATATTTTVVDSFSLRFAGKTVRELHPDILCMYEDKKGNYWFGTNGGLFRYDGEHLFRFTYEDGLTQNQILSIQEDVSGSIWMSTGAFGINKFDGKSFSTYTVKSEKTNWSSKTLAELCFRAGAGACFLHNDSIVYYPFPFKDLSSKTRCNVLSAVAVYSILKDNKNNLWFGTQASGVSKFDGKNFTWFTEKNLAGPAVLALAEDKQGNIWMGTNGSGLFCYDGKTLINYSDEHNLGNPAFRINGNSNSNCLARITALQTDKSGVLYIGTADAGLWCIENKQLKHLVGIEAFENKGIECICCDKKGQVFIGTNGAGLFRLVGNFVRKTKIQGRIEKR